MEKDIEKLQAVLKEDPSNFQARRELSILLSKEGFNEEALSNLEFLIKYFPEDADIFYNIGILHEKLKNFREAEKSYKKAIKISPQEDFYYNLGEVLVSLENYDEAIDCFKTVLKTDSQDANCFFNIALCHYHKDEINLATDYFQKAATINPKDIYAHFYLGCIYQKNGLTNFAEESFKKVLSLSPDYSWAYYNLASIAYKNENYEEAKNYLLKTIEYNNDDIEAFKLLTKLFVKEKNFEDIISILETRLEHDENGDLYYILSQVYKKIGNKESYAKNLNLALENKLSLTYPALTVRKELENLLEKESLYVEELSEYSYNEEDLDEAVEESDEN